ncbi:MAG: hypothetical protein ACXV5P_01205 [Halobacteriota archaeon]
MPDLLLHLIVPLAALLLFYDRRYRMYVLLLCPLAILPDIDHLAPGDFARMWLHNIFVLLPPLLAGVYAYEKGYKRAYNIAFIALFYLSCHILLDLFQGGVSLFYPVANNNYAVIFDLLKQGQNVTPNIAFNVSVPRRDPSLAQDVVSSVSVAIAVIFIFVAAMRAVLTGRS